MKSKLIPAAIAAFSIVLAASGRAADAKTAAPPATPPAQAPAKSAPSPAATAAPANPQAPAATDADYAKSLVGSWTEVQKAPGPGAPDFKVANTYNADGTWKSEATIDMMGQSMKMTIAGKWKVADGFIVCTAETSNPPGIVAANETEKEKIVSVTANEANVIQDTGEKTVKTRVGK